MTLARVSLKLTADAKCHERKMSSRDGPPSEADERSLTPAQVQRAREAVEYLSTIPFLRDSGMYMKTHISARHSIGLTKGLQTTPNTQGGYQEIKKGGIKK